MDQELQLEINRLQNQLAARGFWYTAWPVILFSVVSAGAAVWLTFSFLLPPPADLRSEYCRGVADGEVRMYADMRDFMISTETEAAAAGVEVVMVGIKNGEVVQKAKMTEQVFTPQPESYIETVEGSCTTVPDAALLSLGLRGPSDMVTTTTVAP